LCYYITRGDFMNIKYEDLFNVEGLLTIGKEDFELITSGKDIFLKIINIGNGEDATSKIKKSFEKETLYKKSNQAIIYIESKDSLTLVEQANIIEAIRDLYNIEDNNNELSIIYGCAINDKLTCNIKITYLSSRND